MWYDCNGVSYHGNISPHTQILYHLSFLCLGKNHRLKFPPKIPISSRSFDPHTIFSPVNWCVYGFINIPLSCCCIPAANNTHTLKRQFLYRHTKSFLRNTNGAARYTWSTVQQHHVAASPSLSRRATGASATWPSFPRSDVKDEPRRMAVIWTSHRRWNERLNIPFHK